MRALFLFMAVIAGAFMPVQAGVNARLRTILADPFLTAFVSFAVGTAALLAIVLALRVPWPEAAASRGPWWIWIGGLFGVFFVTCGVVLAPRLGAVTMITWVVAGQMAASILLDHYGLLGYAVREATPLRILGALLVAVGAVLVQKY